ncbi:polyheme membrane-associated cytochrome C [Yoonia sp. F2084L]|uniref:polyheme membrane-associated cytochrome C n=1 Tax=Yoonia sp. F2084L TaxID=2926419 RepID=UPI001FF3C64C|nr:polyheme membrane-associated cytochrome C [Yoonia sp. F2084L]MCK0097360.1 polyheme membrane-associated cytochrome C [Yoonia sp. F2084L]
MPMMMPLTKMITASLLIALASTQAAAQDTPDDGPSLDAIVDAWLASPHASRSSEAFTHWHEEGEIPGTCAVCHSSTGAVDYLLGEMTQPGVIDHAVPTGTSVDCVVCHTSAASSLAIVPFPSGETVDTFEESAVCTVCHQGRTSTFDVESAVAGLEDDVIAGDLSFINIHYAPSAATLMGTAVRGGYEYDGKVYKGQFTHVPDMNGCVDCHRPHSLEVQLDNCTACHQGVTSFTDIRTTTTDFDGDGDTTVGISVPINALHARLETAIQSYGMDIAGTPIVYNVGSYPYFFIDSDADGIASDDESIYPNRYQSWTPRLLKAAYNYQVVAKDTGIYTHNPHYALQLLYDSLESLSEQVDVDMTGLVRP